MTKDSLKKRMASHKEKTRSDASILVRTIGEFIQEDYARRLAVKKANTGTIILGIGGAYIDDYTYQVFNRAEHAPYVEFGTGILGEGGKPRKAPPMVKTPSNVKHGPPMYSPPILKWARQRRLMLQSVIRKRVGGKMRFYRLTRKAALMWASYRIAMKIKVKGTEPFPAFRKAIYAAKSKWPEMARDISNVKMRS